MSTPIMLSPDVFMSAAGYVHREFGHTGYRLGLERASILGGIGTFRLRSSDGGERLIVAGEYGAAVLPEDYETLLPGAQNDAMVDACRAAGIEVSR